MIDKDDCHKIYYLVDHNIDGLGRLVVSHSAFDKSVFILDDVLNSYYWLSTYEVFLFEHNGEWISDHNLCGHSIVIDNETVEMVEIERTEGDDDLPSGFRRV